MIRLCGANDEQPIRAQRACWCLGLFCGRGGARRTDEFRRDFKVATGFATRQDFDWIIGQDDLFNGTATGDKWRARLDGHARG